MDQDFSELRKHVDYMAARSNPSRVLISAMITLVLYFAFYLLVVISTYGYDALFVLAAIPAVLFIDWAYYTVSWAVHFRKYKEAHAFGSFLVSYSLNPENLSRDYEDYLRIVKSYNHVCHNLKSLTP